jgi:DNA-binding transcriptional ArsR family regulator
MLGLAPSTVSKHMTILQQADLVERRKEGRWHYYRLPGEEITPLVQQTLAWVKGSLGRCPAVLEDQKRLRGILKKERQELCGCYKS